MCNCNQKRSAYSAQQETASRGTRGMVKVKLIGGDPIALSGNVTGRTYVFREINDVHMVDKRDATGMKDVKGLQFFY